MDIDCRFALSTSEAWELSTLTHKLKTILEHLKKKMEECIRYIGKPVLCCVIDHAMPYIEMNAWKYLIQLHTISTTLFCTYMDLTYFCYIRYHLYILKFSYSMQRRGWMLNLIKCLSNSSKWSTLTTWEFSRPWFALGMMC